MRALLYERFGGPVTVADVVAPLAPDGRRRHPGRRIRALPQRLARVGGP